MGQTASCCGCGRPKRASSTDGDVKTARSSGGGGGGGGGKGLAAYCCCCCPRVIVRHRAFADEEEKIPIVEAPGAIPLPRREPSTASEQMTRSPETGKTPEADLLTRGKKMFNSNPDKGMRYLQQQELVGNTPAAVATFLRDATFLDKVKIGEYLGGHDDFHLAVLESYTAQQNFDKMPFDAALRKFLASFRLPGEAQKIERIMERFAATYTARNPGVFVNSDTAFVLAFSLIMLNTDLHNPNVKHRMTKAGFIKNNRGINNGNDLPEEFLTTLYDSFKNEQLQMDEGVTFNDVGYTFVNTERAGYLWKLNSKLVGWNRRYFVITGNVLYYFKTQEEKTPSAIIPLEQLAVREVELGGMLELGGGQRFAFELFNPDNEGTQTGTIKAVKRSGGTLSSSAHKTFIFASESAEDRSDWIRAIRSNMAPRQMYQMVRAHRGRASGAVTKALVGASDSDSITPAFAAAAAAAADGTTLSLGAVSTMDGVDGSYSVAASSAVAPSSSSSAATASTPSSARTAGVARTPSTDSTGTARAPMIRAPSSDATVPTPRALAGSVSSSTDPGDVPVLSPPPSAAFARLRSGHGRSTSDTANLVGMIAAADAARVSGSSTGEPSPSTAAGPTPFGGLAAQVVFSAGPPALREGDVAATLHPTAGDDVHPTADDDNDGGYLLGSSGAPDQRAPRRSRGRRDGDDDDDDTAASGRSDNQRLMD